MTASDIDRLRELGLLPEEYVTGYQTMREDNHCVTIFDDEGSVAHLFVNRIFADAAINALAAVAVEQHERAESWKSRYGIQGKSDVNCQYDYEQEKARADTAQANLEVCATSLHLAEDRAAEAEAMLTVAFDTYQAGVENGGYWEHCTYTQWLADLARRRLEELRAKCYDGGTESAPAPLATAGSVTPEDESDART